MYWIILTIALRSGNDLALSVLLTLLHQIGQGYGPNLPDGSKEHATTRAEAVQPCSIARGVFISGNAQNISAWRV